jgi:hypothetical protein
MSSSTFHTTTLLAAVLLGLFFSSKYLLAAKSESFTCTPDIYDHTYRTVVKSKQIDPQHTATLLARNPKYVNHTIVPLGSVDIPDTTYFTAYSAQGDLLGYIKMAQTEQFMAKLIDLGMYEQELFGFSGWRGLHIYEAVALNDHIMHKLFKRAIHALKQDSGRYYLSILCTTESLGKTLIDNFRFILTLKEPSRRFYNSTLYTLVYFK